MLKHGIYLVKGSKYTINIWSLFETCTGRCLLELSWEISVTNLNEAFRESLETLMICVEISNLHLRHSAGQLAGAWTPQPHHPQCHLRHLRKMSLFQFPAKLSNYSRRYSTGRKIKLKMLILYF